MGVDSSQVYAAAAAQRLERRNGSPAGFDQFRLVHWRRSAGARSADKCLQFAANTLVLAEARLAAPDAAILGDGQATEILDGGHCAAGKDFDQFLAQGSIALRRVSDGGEAAVGKIKRNGHILGGGAGAGHDVGMHRNNRRADQEARQIDEVANLA